MHLRVCDYWISYQHYETDYRMHERQYNDTENFSLFLKNIPMKRPNLLGMLLNWTIFFTQLYLTHKYIEKYSVCPVVQLLKIQYVADYPLLRVFWFKSTLVEFIHVSKRGSVWQRG